MCGAGTNFFLSFLTSLRDYTLLRAAHHVKKMVMRSGFGSLIQEDKQTNSIHAFRWTDTHVFNIYDETIKKSCNERTIKLISTWHGTSFQSGITLHYHIPC